MPVHDRADRFAEQHSAQHTIEPMFCHCGSYRLPGHDGWRCRRGCGQPVTDFDFTTTTPQRNEPSRYVPEDAKFLPTTTANCPECGHSKAEFKQQQIRSIDEPITRIYRCTACGHRWRKDG